eukprot:1157013-Pelagomonas_calceolata.AAC.10
MSVQCSLSVTGACISVQPMRNQCFPETSVCDQCAINMQPIPPVTGMSSHCANNVTYVQSVTPYHGHGPPKRGQTSWCNHARQPGCSHVKWEDSLHAPAQARMEIPC